MRTSVRTSVSLLFVLAVLISLPVAYQRAVHRQPLDRGHDLPPKYEKLIQAAKRTLGVNWLGHSTKPAPKLYPHQWSWDSAFIALGKSYFDQEQEELQTLFQGQWANGLVPHIVFNLDAPAYFPGWDWWDSRNATPHAPRTVATSGILQPPVHAIAALKIWENRASNESALAFLEALFPKLAQWHAFLYKERQWRHGLVWIRHPWESGMDNSPLWDEALTAIDIVPGMVPPYNRSDDKIVNGTDRPSKWTYDRFVWLVEQARREGYDEARIADIKGNNFLVVDVLFNALLARANGALAQIAEILKRDPTPYLVWKVATEDGVNTWLWDKREGFYRNYDLIQNRFSPVESMECASAFAPLYAGIPNQERTTSLMRRLNSNHFTTLDEMRGRKVWPIPTFARTSTNFSSHNYWRGPVWLNINWLLYKGMHENPNADAQDYAKALREATLDLVDRTPGMWEYYDAYDASGHGTATFSWTAALVIDLILE